MSLNNWCCRPSLLAECGLHTGDCSSAAIPKSKNLYSFVVGAHAIIKVIAKAAQVNASNPGKLGFLDNLTNDRLLG